MSPRKQAMRDAKQLFQFCVSNGMLDQDKVRQVVQQVSESRNRNRYHVLAQLRRLVKLDHARHTAAVEIAAPLSSEMQAVVHAELARVYGPGLTTSFTQRPDLIGGMRIKVGSDVYDGSVRGRLTALEAGL